MKLTHTQHSGLSFFVTNNFPFLSQLFPWNNKYGLGVNSCIGTEHLRQLVPMTTKLTY